MDNPMYTLVGIGLIVIIFGAPFFKRWANRKASAVGERAGKRFADHQVAKANEKLPELLNEIGTTIVLTVPFEQAREIVETAAAKKKRDYKDLDATTFGIRFTEPDDGAVTFEQDDLGTRVQVERFREHLGYPMIAPLWKKFRDNIAEAAAAAGVTSAPGPVQTYVRGRIIDDKNSEWTLSS